MYISRYLVDTLSNWRLQQRKQIENMAQSLEEIYADKILAFALGRGRIKSRDLWDLLWLKQQAIKPAFELLANKLKDHQCSQLEFLNLAHERAQSLINDVQVKKDFRNEMPRFLPTEIVEKTINNEQFWAYLCVEIPSLITQEEQNLTNNMPSKPFLM